MQTKEIDYADMLDPDKRASQLDRFRNNPQCRVLILLLSHSSGAVRTDKQQCNNNAIALWLLHGIDRVLVCLSAHPDMHRLRMWSCAQHVPVYAWTNVPVRYAVAGWPDAH